MSDRVHDLKTHPTFFRDISDGHKTFEVRRDDRGFRVGDLLILHEWPVKGYDCLCSSDSCLSQTNRFSARVTYILRGGEFGVEPGFVVMGLDNYAPVSSTRENGET